MAARAGCGMYIVSVIGYSFVNNHDPLSDLYSIVQTQICVLLVEHYSTTFVNSVGMLLL